MTTPLRNRPDTSRTVRLLSPWSIGVRLGLGLLTAGALGAAALFALAVVAPEIVGALLEVTR